MTCTCHQCSGDSWDCPEHYRKNQRYHDTARTMELATGTTPLPSAVKNVLRQIDAERAERQKAFWAEMNANLDRKGVPR